MKRDVSAQLDVSVYSASRLVFQVGVAGPGGYGATEQIRLTLDGADVEFRELDAPHAGRVWLFDSPPGRIRLSYSAQLNGNTSPESLDVTDEFVYLRPSRYCESDRLTGFAHRHFHDIDQPSEILAAVSSWVGTQLEYVSGSSGPTDGAIDTLLAGRGVCRDYAHLAVALLRALDVPARLVAVYAPGLSPMDFHAVAEAFVDGAWYVVDGTLLAPRSSLVRITTGRDASDTSFLSTYGGNINLDNMWVTATVDGDLPVDDVKALVQLG